MHMSLCMSSLVNTAACFVCGGVQHCRGILRLLQPPAELTQHTNLYIQTLRCIIFFQGQDGSPPAWPADRLLMLNDVYFCHQGLIRLLRHSSAAIACGIDFFIDPPGGIVLYDLWVMRDAVRAV